MKLVFFNDFTLGVLADGKVHDITSAVKDGSRPIEWCKSTSSC